MAVLTGCCAACATTLNNVESGFSGAETVKPLLYVLSVCSLFCVERRNEREG